MSDRERALAVRVTGRVQNVGYRAWTQTQARNLGLRGWVANHEAGHVDAVFVGPGDVLATIVALCRQGPASARVEHVDARSIDKHASREPPSDAFLF